MAASSLPRRGSSVKRKPRRYSSKLRRCCSQRAALCIRLTLLSMAYPRPTFGAPQYPAHESRRLLAGEPLRELHGLVDGDIGWYVLHEEHLVERQPQNRAVDRAHPVYGPPDRDLGEQRVQLLLLPLDPPRQPDGILVEIPPVRPPAFERRLDGTPVDVALVQDEKGLLACLPPAQGSDPRQVLVRARVHPHPVTNVDEERHLHHEPGLEGSGLAPPGGRVALEPGVGVGYLEVHVRRRLDAHDLTIRREHAYRAVGHDVSGRHADYVFLDRDLLVGLGVHEVEEIPIPIEISHRPRLGPHALELLARPEGFLDHRPRVDVAQPLPDERPTLAGLDVLEIEDREPLAIHPDGTAVPELVGGYHGQQTPLRNASSQRAGADAAILSHIFRAR